MYRLPDFDEAMQFVLKWEGGFVDRKGDKGGATNAGISMRFLKLLPYDALKKYGLPETITKKVVRDLTPQQIKAIYLWEFWLKMPLLQVKNPDVRIYIFDMAICMGIQQAVKLVQRACWAIQGKWDKLEDDGVMGNKTLEAINICGTLLLFALRAERGAFYRYLGEKDKDEKEILNGRYNRTYGYFV